MKPQWREMSQHLGESVEAENKGNTPWRCALRMDREYFAQRGSRCNAKLRRTQGAVARSTFPESAVARLCMLCLKPKVSVSGRSRRPLRNLRERASSVTAAGHSKSSSRGSLSKDVSLSSANLHPSRRRPSYTPVRAPRSPASEGQTWHRHNGIPEGSPQLRRNFAPLVCPLRTR